MAASFHTLTQVRPLGDGHFQAQIPDGWQQGRGAFGGVVFGVLLRAARAFEQDAARVARSFACDVAAAVMPGEATVRVRELRRGRSQTNLQLELVQGDAVVASAIATMSGARGTSAPSVEPTPPREASFDPQRVPVFPVAPPIGPVFAQNYEYRVLYPVTPPPAEEAVTRGFVREKAGQGTLDPSALSALLDSWWPALYSLTPRPFPMTTVSYNAQFLPGSEALPADQPLYLATRALTQRDGYSVDFRELWSRDRLIALNQQTFAALG